MAATGSGVAEAISPPTAFPFPFPPYNIQTEFMTALFRTLNQGDLGVFESPTGTGKSLSIICGTLTWFLEHQKARQERLSQLVNSVAKDEDNGDDDDWIKSASKKMEVNQKRLEAKGELERMEKRKQRLDKIRARRQNIQVTEVEKSKEQFDELFKEMKWIKQAVEREISQNNAGGEAGDEDIVLAEYVSDDEDGDDKMEDIEAEMEEKNPPIKIYFCSRTHSQLTQFVREVKKSPFAKDITLVSLASRGVLCINPSVASLPSQAAINEACLALGRKKGSRSTQLDDDLRPVKKSKSKLGSGCPYNKQANIEQLRDQSILAVQDIEDMVKLGKKMNSCPYYASRSAVPLVDMVVLPYNTLLHAATRQAIGLNLRNSIVIVDEAHNLLETIANIHSVAVTANQLSAAFSQLSQYKDKYKARLSAKNLLYVKQILFILSSFIKYLGGTPGQDPSLQQNKINKDESKLMEVGEFLYETEIYNQPLLKLVKYCNVSQICNKLHGFVEKYQPPVTMPEVKQEPVKGVTAYLNKVKAGSIASGQSPQASKAAEKENESVVGSAGKPSPATASGGTSSPLLGVVEFLSTLATVFADSKIVVKRGRKVSESSFRFLLLDPSSQFKEIVESARSVVVAGGTMQPVEEFKQQLFLAGGAVESRIRYFSCDHVVPANHILPVILQAGPTGQKLDFSYQHRDTKNTLDELGRVLSNLVNVIPAGMVVFFPSYDYEDQVYKHLERSGVIDKINTKKKVFREPRGAEMCERVLSDYARTVRLGIDGSKGAILSAVVGGKMSEGINFSDGLGRCVVMVGLPYPNMYSPELQEKMTYLNSHLPNYEDGRTAGQVHYENLCMKAVNQSVGRAIRHIQDYAAIILLDHRYSRPSIVNQLPGWIRRHVRCEAKFGPMVPLVRKFFKEKTETIGAD